MSDEKKFEKMMEDLNNEIEKSAKDNAVPSLFSDKVTDLLNQIVSVTDELVEELPKLDKDTVMSGFNDEHAKFKHLFIHCALKDMLGEIAVVKGALRMTRKEIDDLAEKSGESVSEMSAKCMMQMIFSILK